MSEKLSFNELLLKALKGTDAHWEIASEHYIRCSRCGSYFDNEIGAERLAKEFLYCPGCGTKMEEKK